MIGLLISGYFLARGILNIPAGILGDRKGQKKVMGYGLLLVATSSVLAGLAFNYWVLLAVRVVEGIGSAFYVTSSLALLAKAVPSEKRGQYMSYYVAALLAGAVSGPAAGGYIALYLGLRAPFFFYALAATIALVLMKAFLPVETRKIVEEPFSPRDVSRVLRNRSFLLVNLATISAFFVRGGINLVIFPVWSAARFGFNPGIVGVLLTVAALSSIGTMFPSGHMADRYGRKVPFMLSLLSTAVVLPFIFYADSFSSLTLMMVLYGLALGLHGPMAAWAADLAPPESMGTTMGVYRTLGDMGWVLGPLVLTYVAEATGPIESSVWPFLAASIWTGFFGLLLLPAKDPASRAGRRAEVLADGKGQPPPYRGST
jgi:MFS family permease